MAHEKKSNFLTKISPLIEGQVPDFVQADHPLFVNFLKDYYQFLEAAVKIKNIVHNNQSTQMAVQSGLTAKSYLSYEEMMPYVYPIQEYLIGIGFLDEGDDDGIMGSKTEGAIKRYEYNKPGIIEETWHSIKNMYLNLFK